MANIIDEYWSDAFIECLDIVGINVELTADQRASVGAHLRLSNECFRESFSGPVSHPALDECATLKRKILDERERSEREVRLLLDSCVRFSGRRLDAFFAYVDGDRVVIEERR